jgi:hypothetical protein
MPKYFFDKRDNGVLEPDEEGMEFPDLDAAIKNARERFVGRFEGPDGDGQEPPFRVEIREEDAATPAFVLDAGTASGSGTP